MLLNGDTRKGNALNATEAFVKQKKQQKKKSNTGMYIYKKILMPFLCREQWCRHSLITSHISFSKLLMQLRVAHFVFHFECSYMTCSVMTKHK